MSTDERGVSRRRFARGVLLAAPVAVAAELLPATSAEAASASWAVGGNALTGTGVFGTTSQSDVAVRTSGAERMRVHANGQISIGTATAAGLLHVQGTGKAMSSLLVEQPNTAELDAVTVTSATTSSGNAVAATLTAGAPGSDAAAVYGLISSSGTSDGAAIWGTHEGTGNGVYGTSFGTGVAGHASTYTGLGGLFTNPTVGSSGTPGAAVRGLAAGAAYGDLHPSGTSFVEAAGEFAGAHGVIGASLAGHSGGIGVIGLGPGNAGYGVLGEAFGSDVAGVRGYHPTSGQGVRGVAGGAGVGVYGSCNNTSGTGGEFTNRASNPGAGVRGESGAGTTDILDTAREYAGADHGGGEFTGGSGVVGAGAGSYSTGVVGVAPGDSGYGVTGHCRTSGEVGVAGYGDPAGGGIGYLGRDGVGVVAIAGGSGGDALDAYGDVSITGSISKGGGSFKIDHPLDPANKYLYHSFVESPDMLNVYSGTVELDADGAADVAMPAWFDALNRDVRYQLTPIGAPAPNLHVSTTMRHGRFGIAGGVARQHVSWQVTGVRQDAWANAHRIPVEVDKPASDRGRYLHPELAAVTAARPVSDVARVTSMRRRWAGSSGVAPR